MISIQRIAITHPLYEAERILRNKVLLRPIGVPDHAWEMHDENSWHFVATDADAVVGCVVLVPLEANKSQLIQMAVDNRYQGKGIGRKLVAALIAFSTSHGILEITCHARENVVDFYKRMGFKVYGEAFIEVGIVHRHMRLVV